MNKIVGYRKMLGLTQGEMARYLNISEVTYRNKEKGISAFKDKEMKLFYEVFSRKNSKITIEDIFFS
ncbi:helix-turn-helix domain-containing protein [Lysinibacillus sp. FSL K6-0075]|uniref:helix-turn-helix transcriptional regulator n=1 Tax=Lysinibacillus sp. FSL K6-0075 TaxID=2921415 RepID=UPI003158910A